MNKLPAEANLIVIRVDSGNSMGSGHIRRCLSVAQFLQKNGLMPVFICRQAPGDISDSIAKAGFALLKLPANPALTLNVFDTHNTSTAITKMAEDARESAELLRQHYPDEKIHWAITDHLHIRSPWQQIFRKQINCGILAIDGLANSTHSADILLDPQISAEPHIKWQGLLPYNCFLFSGPSHLPLSESFEETRKKATTRTATIKRILICFGGTDTDNIICRTANTLQRWIQKQQHAIQVDIALPSQLDAATRLKTDFASDNTVKLHFDLNDLSQLMLKADLAIGGGGIMLWERCLLGLPTLAVPLAENQKSPIAQLAEEQALIELKTTDSFYEQALTEALEQVSASQTLLPCLSENAFQIMSRWPDTDQWLALIKSNTV